jgi:hypothetical protein
MGGGEELDRYAWYANNVCLLEESCNGEGAVTIKARLKRKPLVVDEHALHRAKKALGVKTDAEVIRLSAERIAEMEAFWKCMDKSRHTLSPGSIVEAS